MSKEALINIIDIAISLGQAWGIEGTVGTDDPMWGKHHVAGVLLLRDLMAATGIDLADIPTRERSFDPAIARAEEKLKL